MEIVYLDSSETPTEFPSWMMELFRKYELQLKTIQGTMHVVSDNDKMLILSQLLDRWHRPEDILEDLLPEVDIVLNGTLSSNDVSADVVGVAYIEPKITKLTGSTVGYADIELPTSEFKGLILEWCEVLRSNGERK